MHSQDTQITHKNQLQQTRHQSETELSMYCVSVISTTLLH